MLRVSGSFSELRMEWPPSAHMHPSFWAKLLVPSLRTACHGIPGSGLPAWDGW